MLHGIIQCKYDNLDDKDDLQMYQYSFESSTLTLWQVLITGIS